MAYVKLENGGHQIFKGMKISAPTGAYVFDSETDEPIAITERTVFTATGNNRKGIGRYRINMTDQDGKSVYCMNYMMDDDKRKYHAIWRLEQPPMSAEEIFKVYGYRITEDHQRLKKYKLTGRVRARKIAKALKDAGRYQEANDLLSNMEQSLVNGKRFICFWPKDLHQST